MMVSNRNLLFQGLIFRFHVKLQGCKEHFFCCFEFWPLLGSILFVESSFVPFFGCGPSTFFDPTRQKKLTSLRGKASACARVLVGCQTWTIRVKRRTLLFSFREGSINEGYPTLPVIAAIPLRIGVVPAEKALFFSEKKLGRVAFFFFSGSNIKIHKQDYATSMDLLDESCRSNLWSVFKLVAEWRDPYFMVYESPHNCEVIQFVTCLSPNVGGQPSTFWKKGHVKTHHPEEVTNWITW